MKEISRILNNEPLLELVRSLQESLDEKRSTLIEELSPDIDLLIESRNRVLEKPEFYIDQACENIENNRGECYFAKDSDEAIDFIEMVLGETRNIIVSSSEEIRDISLVNVLREKGYDVFYSCLPHFLADVSGVKYPSMYTFKYLREEDILSGLRKLFGKDYLNLKEAEKDVIEFLKNNFSKAELSITGADALAADTGSIFIIDYTGDIRLATGTPKTHIAVVGIDKIYPTYIEAWTATYIRFRFSSIYNPSGISIISGPSATGDIEKVTTYGAHGPEKLIVILLDNGRRNFYVEREFRTLSKCISCNSCLLSIPLIRSLIDNLIRPFSNAKELTLLVNNLGDDEKRLLGSILTYYIESVGEEYKCPFGVEIKDVLKTIKLWNEDIPDDVKETLKRFMETVKRRKTFVR